MSVEFDGHIREVVEKIIAGTSHSILKETFSSLHSGYTGDRNAAMRLLRDEERIAYLVARFPNTFAACGAVYDSLLEREKSFNPRSVLDIGAGPGTASLKALSLFPSIQSVTLVERDRGFIEIGRELFKVVPGQISWVPSDLLAFKSNSNFDLVVASYSVGEILKGDIVKVAKQLWTLSDGMIVVIEPGTPTGFENIINIRSELLKLGAFIVAPCTNQFCCPLAESGQHKWCHFRVRLERSKLARSIKEAELGYEDESFSYLIASKVQLPGYADLPSRVISRPRKEKGWIGIEVCSPQAKIESMRILKRNKVEYKKASRLSWGELWKARE